MLRGQLDLAKRELVSGWAWETDTPELPVTLLVSADDVLIARVAARSWRRDLEEAGVGQGRHAFEVRPGAALWTPTRHVVSVQRESDGAHIAGSPAVIEAATRFDDAARTAFAALVESAETISDLEEHIRYLAAQTARLLQRRADRSSRRALRGHEQFTWRWNGDVGGTSQEAGLGRRVLVVDETMPRGGHDAGANAILSHMAALRRLGFEVVFAAADMRGGDATALDALSVASCDAPWYASVEEVLRREAQTFDLVYLHRIGTAARYLPLVRFHQPKARVLFSVADLSHVRLARQARVEDRPELLSFARARRAGELAAAMAADAVLTHSSAEAALLRRDGVPEGKIHCVRWSVTPEPTAVPFAARNGVAFVAGYAHEPNVDAACRLVEEVMPRVWARDATIACLLVGSEMPERVRSLARPGVEVVGPVESLGEVFDRVRLTVAPLRYGAGIKGKVIDSLAAGIPCVCTSVAAEGLDLPDWVAVADAPDRIAALILDCTKTRR